MKKIITILSLLLIITGCTPRDYSDNGLLKEDELITILKENEIKIKVVDADFKEELGYKGNSPTVVQLDDSRYMLLVYTFANFEERREASRDGLMSNEFNNKLRDLNLDVNSHPINAKNSLLIYVSSRDQSDTNYEELFELTKKVDLIISNEINNTKEYVYTGSGEYWEGSIKLRYYEHWLKDEDGSLIDYDSFHNNSAEIFYKGQDTETVDSFEYSYEYKTFGGSGKSDSLNKYGSFHINSSTGSGIPGAHGFYEMTIKWDDKEETIILKAER